MTDPIAEARAEVVRLLRAYIKDDTGLYVKFSMAAVDAYTLAAFDLGVTAEAEAAEGGLVDVVAEKRAQLEEGSHAD